MELHLTIDANKEAKEIADKAEQDILVCEWSDKLSREDKIELYEIINDAVRLKLNKQIKYVSCE